MAGGCTIARRARRVALASLAVAVIAGGSPVAGAAANTVSAPRATPSLMRPDPDPHPCSTDPDLSTHDMAETVDLPTYISDIIDAFDEIDVAAHGGKKDGRFTKNDLKAVDDDEDASTAAAYLASRAQGALFDVIDTDGAGNGFVSTDGRVSAHDLDTFLEKRDDLARVFEHWDELDVAAHPDKKADDLVSDNDFAAAKESGDFSKAELAAFDRVEDLNIRIGSRYLALRDVVRELVRRRAFVEDGTAANAFVRALPMARNARSSGLRQYEFEPDDVTALAKAALVPAKDDYTDVQSVIAHLPETDDATRNKLITGFYCDMARRADAMFSVSDSAIPPGANWLDYAPWASFSVGKVIGADMRAVFGFDPPPGARQAAGDGNQWIFNDITSKFAAFLELYERTDGEPTAKQLASFFTAESPGGTPRFGDGAHEIRSAFVLYAASKREDDPATRQRLMFQANALVAIHEQAGVDGYLEDVMVGPAGVEVYDWKASQYMDMTMGGYVLEVNKDLDDNELGIHSSNLIDDNDVLDLDPGTLDIAEFEADLGLDLPSIDGWTDEQDGRTPKKVDTDVSSWQERKGKVSSGSTVDDSLEATGVGSWGDYGDRMWFLFRLFEQLHVDSSVPPRTVEVPDRDASEADLVGAWRGSVTQDPPWPAPYSVIYDFRLDGSGRLTGTTVTPEIGCGGDVTFVSAEPGVWTFDERLTFGEETCVDEGRFTVSRRSDGALQLQWQGDSDVNGTTITATAVLRRMDVAATLPVGTWTGPVTQRPSARPYDIEVTIGPGPVADSYVVGVEYSIACGGTSEFVTSVGGTWTFRENIEYGDCIDGGIMTFDPEPDGTIAWAWRGTADISGEDVFATSTLRPA